MLDKLENHVKVAAAAVAAVAAYMYGVAYFALSEYYGNFGISPVEAGVTRSTVVAVSFVGFGFIAGLVLLVGLSGWSVAKALATAGEQHQFLWARRAAVIGGVGVFAAAAALVGRVPTLGVVLSCLSVGTVMAAVSAERPTEPEPQAAAPRERRWLLPLAATTVVAAAWIFLMGVVGATESVARVVMRDGSAARASNWETITKFALGINPIPVYADGITCAVAVAFDGNRAWIMESPGETAAIRIVPRDSLTVRYSTKSGSSTPRATPRACWRDT